MVFVGSPVTRYRTAPQMQPPSGTVGMLPPFPGRDERWHAPRVSDVLISEALGHPALLEAKLPPKRRPGNQHGEHTAPFAESDGGADEGDEQSRVDWVADHRIRTGV